METSSQTNNTPAELIEFRRQIDTLDDQIIELLKQRMDIVSQVGKMKKSKFPGICPIRSGREAEMVRRVAGKFEGSSFPPAAAAAIWRILIGASTSVENLISASVFAPENTNDLLWMAREYFGPFTPVTKHGHANRVIGDVLDGKSSVGIFPPFRDSAASQWWTALLQQQGADAPKLFAHLPYVYFGTQPANATAAMAIAKLSPEPTGDDLSIIVVSADMNISQNRIQTAFAASSLNATWIDIAPNGSIGRYHLLEIDGFVTADHPDITAIRSALGSSIIDIHFLGAYAKPITLKFPGSKMEGSANGNNAGTK